MNTLDLTKTGGFPFTQDMLDWIQQNSLAVMNMLGAKMLPDSLANTANTPVALTGINPGTGTIYKAGWLWYNNEILRFPTDIDVSTLPTLTGGLVYGFSIVEVDTPVAYFDGTSHNTKISRTLTIASGANTLTASFIPLTTTIYYFDNGLRETAWHTATLSGVPSGVGGTINYRKNFLTNTLQLEIAVTITSSVIPTGYIGSIGTLPSGYRPVATLWFAGVINNMSADKYDNQTPSAPIVAIPISIDNTGVISIRTFGSPAGGTYTFSLCVNMPLD